MVHLRSLFRSSQVFNALIRTALTVVLFLGLPTLNLIAQSDTSHAVETESRTFIGQLRLVSMYGPPGFGENPKVDSRVHYLVLHIKAPVSLPCGPNDLPTDSTVCPKTDKLQLIFDVGVDPLAQKKAGRYVGKRISVTGSLQHASTAAEATPIVLWVKSIAVAP
jgi:hypothetical protein